MSVLLHWLLLSMGESLPCFVVFWISYAGEVLPGCQHVLVCVSVCIFVPIFSGVGLHLSADISAGVTQEEEEVGALLFVIFFAPPPFCGAPKFSSREMFSRPFPSSTLKSEVCVRTMCSLSAFNLSFSTRCPFGDDLLTPHSGHRSLASGCTGGLWTLYKGLRKPCEGYEPYTKPMWTPHSSQQDWGKIKLVVVKFSLFFCVSDFLFSAAPGVLSR